MSGSASPEEREAARVRVFELVHQIQSGADGAADELARLASVAEGSDWPEVARACLFGRAVQAWIERDEGLPGAIDRLIERAAADGSSVMTALGLAMRSVMEPGMVPVDTAGAIPDSVPAGDHEPVSSAGARPPADGSRPAQLTESIDADLARATAMLDAATGPPEERISAHTACGIAFVNRWLWELGDEQYAVALSIGEAEPPGSLDHLLAPIVFNRAEALVAWASTLRQLGDRAIDASSWKEWEAAGASLRSAAAATTPAMPPGWRAELDALRLLLLALEGEDLADEAGQLLEYLGPDAPGTSRVAGHLLLALALAHAAAGRPEAASATEAALAALDPLSHPHEYDLALYLAAEIEAAAGRRAGLRLAERQLSARWNTRLATLASMQTRIAAERRFAEMDSLRRDARRDDLTGVGNRRELERYLAGLADAGTDQVALILADVDRFKGVNDRFGHDAGDAALVGLARVLERGVRPEDLVVRFGGDEFGAVLAEAGVAVAEERARAVLVELERLRWPEVDPELRIAVSLGVAAGSPGHLDVVKAAADQALYEAKAAGGARVVCRHGEPPGRDQP